MNTLYFEETAKPVSDYAAQALAEQLRYHDIHTSNDLVVTEARAMFKQGEIPKFRIVFEGDEVPMDDEAGIANWPSGFGDRLDRLYKVLFGL